MNYRWALLLQSLLGSKFQIEELDRLMEPALDPCDLAGVLACIPTHPLRIHPKIWIEEAERVRDVSEQRGFRWVCRGGEDYPMGWLHLQGQSPLIFSYQGEPVWKHFDMVAVVGSRTPMRETLSWMQRELPSFLAASPDVAIVSGGARGVDQWAHRISIDMGRPTVCIFPSGLNCLYPPGIDDLTAKILKGGGTLLSTFALDEPMRRHMFVTRNRWIAGMACLTFVAEANRRSGSSLTAKLAQEESREVCTLPVFPHSEQGLGNLDLLTDLRAALIRDARDLIQITDLNSRTFRPRRL